MPAGSSRVRHSSDQSDWPSERRSTGSAIPAPSSLTVMRQASAMCSAVTVMQVAPARRAFWKSSLKMSSRVPLKMRVTFEIACGETRARSLVIMVMGSCPGWTGTLPQVAREVRAACRQGCIRRRRSRRLRRPARRQVRLRRHRSRDRALPGLLHQAHSQPAPGSAWPRAPRRVQPA